MFKSHTCRHLQHINSTQVNNQHLSMAFNSFAFSSLTSNSTNPTYTLCHPHSRQSTHFCSEIKNNSRQNSNHGSHAPYNSFLYALINHINQVDHSYYLLISTLLSFATQTQLKCHLFLK